MPENLGGDHRFPRKPSAKGAGRNPDGTVKPHERDERVAAQVEVMAAMGLSENEICVQLDIRPGQLKEHYGRELDVARNKANLQVARAVFEKAKGGDMTAAKFWLQNRAGWAEKQDVKVGLSLEQLVHQSMTGDQKAGGDA